MKKRTSKKKTVTSQKIQVVKSLKTTLHGGHALRTGKEVVDRSLLGKSPDKSQKISLGKKKPNQYTGHTFKNKSERFRLDGHKLLHHLDRVLDWQRNKRIAPIHIDMGLTKFCNMGCVYCMGVAQGMVKGALIKRDALMRFIDDCGRLKVRSIAFIGDGEPTLNPAMYDAVVRAKKRNIDVGIATNGLLLRMDRAHDLLKNATFIRFNLSAGDKKGFARIHQVSEKSFDVLIDKIRNFAKIKKENNYKCTLGIQMILLPENFDQVLKLAKLGVKLGVDYFQIKQCSDTEYGEIGVDHAAYKKAQGILKKAEKYSNDSYLVRVKWSKININEETQLYKNGFRKYDICYGTPFLGQVSGNGKVYPCGPFFGKERFCMGDIHKKSYYGIVQSAKYWKVHKDIAENIDVHCDCTVGCRQDYINKFLWDIKNPPEHINFI
ncbi:MAG: radical SAM protein [Candidatus Aceula meridiana]|nr:radical SAM protein [Candidatus Aceula meridiana]